MSVDPRRTQPFCDGRCYRECRCSRWPNYVNRFGWPVRPVTWMPALPTTDGGLLPEHWYRSDQGLWQDAGITAAAADGDVVGRWEDLTANNDHVNQAAAGNKPTLQNGAGDLLNGHPVVRWDGIDDRLVGAFTTGGAMSATITVFVVTCLNALLVDDGLRRYMFESDDAVNRLFIRQEPAVPDYSQCGSWPIGNLIGTATDADWHIWTVLENGAASRFWKDGIAECAVGALGAAQIDGFEIGGRGAGEFWGGDYTEVILYDAALSDTDSNQVGNYLATRYGLAYTDI